MRGLVYKDLMTEAHELKRMGLILLIFVIGFPAMMYASSGDLSEIYDMPMTMCTVMGMVMINNTFGYDEKSGWMQYALTNPVSRMQYYHSKFMTHAVNVLCGSVLGLVVGVILAGVTGQLTLAVLGKVLATTAGSAFALCLVGIVFIPLMLKFGVQRGAVVMMLVFLTVGGGCAALAVLAVNDGQNPPIWMQAVVAAVIIGTFITLYLLGRKWMMEKEF